MEEILRALLEQLERIGKAHEELYDSDVRQEIGNSLMDGFVRTHADHPVPQEFGMFTPEGNGEVRAAVADFIDAASEKAVELRISCFHDRLAALQNRTVHTQHGYDYEEFLGHSPPEFYDAYGNVVRTQ